MKPSVRAAFVPFTSPLEGVVPYLYLDVKGLVTVGIGNLVDPIQYALPLPFLHPDGRPASRDEIAAEWLRVKSDPHAARQGHLRAKAITTLRLDAAGIDLVVSRKLAQNDDHLRRRFADYDDWPADAQLATLSMAWACGPAFRFPLLEAALKARDFYLAADECHINEAGNPGIVPRNVANKVLYRNAGRVQAFKLDPDAVHYPDDLTAAVQDAPTQPELPNAASSPTVYPSVVHPRLYDAEWTRPIEIHDDDGDE